MEKYDFSGWATRSNLQCSDGLVIAQGAFKHNNGRKVPLVWNHQHNDPLSVLGNVVLEDRPEGTYAYGQFNDSETARHAKMMVVHGDISSLSIFANKLKKNGQHVTHGEIREVSLVLAGANPGAFIESVMCHGESSDESAIIYTGEDISIYHAEDKKKEEADMPENKKTTKNEGADNEETLADVFETLSEKQKTVVYALIGQALAEKEGDIEQSDIDDDYEGGNYMKHNVFDADAHNNDSDEVLSHAEMRAIFDDAKRHGTLKDSVIAHGIENIDYLFPDAKNAVPGAPILISRDMGWVRKVMGGVHHTPFARIKSIFADITEADARAKGYLKGNLKLEEMFGLLKRTTTPQTIYKKQKLDRDDIIDITDFDVVGFIKSEMRTMLDEEIARAVLVGDGRSVASNEKVNETNIRPIWTDSDLFTIKQTVTVASGATSAVKAKAFIVECIKARKHYKGSGSPTLYTTEDMLTDCLLLEDTNQRVIYDSIDKLATALRVKEIVTVPVMEDLSREVGGVTRALAGIIVNLSDYNVGADKGGAVNLFDDFDIDYNAEKYLIETRCSGALVKPYSAIALEFVAGA